MGTVELELSMSKNISRVVGVIREPCSWIGCSSLKRPVSSVERQTTIHFPSLEPLFHYRLNAFSQVNDGVENKGASLLSSFNL